jgi:hypothetical protein
MELDIDSDMLAFCGDAPYFGFSKICSTISCFMGLGWLKMGHADAADSALT